MNRKREHRRLNDMLPLIVPEKWRFGLRMRDRLWLRLREPRTFRWQPLWVQLRYYNREKPHKPLRLM